MAYHIAIVDDDAASLVNVRALLIEKGMKVSCLRSGGDLLKFMEKHTPDLVLLDVVMPDMDGFETLNKLRYLEESLSRDMTPIIFMTGESDTQSERRGLRLGASDFIHKPIDQDVVYNRITNAIKNDKTIASLTMEATVDRLTGFYNKFSGETRITESITDVFKGGTGTFMIFDLDNFKHVNDLYGHDMGDKVLVAFSDVVQANCSEEDVISRIGGDEFAGLFPGITEEPDIRLLVEKLNEGLMTEAKRLMGEDFGIPLGVSAGAVRVTDRRDTYSDLFKMADSAMYTAKYNGKHGYSVYTTRDEEHSDEGDDLAYEIRRMSIIMEERNEKSGAMILGADAFSACYRFIMRVCRQQGIITTGAIFKLNTGDESTKLLFEAAARLGVILQKRFRYSDVICQSKTNQFFVILPGTKEEEADDIIKTITEEWETTEYGQGIRLECARRQIQEIS